MKTAIITGASGNLGQAVTQKFLADGYRVIATAINEKDASSLPAHPNLITKVLDLLNPEACRSMVKDFSESYGNIDSLILLAGGFAMGNIEDTQATDISKMIALNFETAYNLAQPVYNHMKSKGRGRLVFIGARPALLPEDGKSMIAYALSKSLLFTLSEQLNQDAKGNDIVSFVVVPSVLDTPINRTNMPEADFTKWVKPSRLADIIGFICSDAADAIREPVIKVYNNS